MHTLLLIPLTMLAKFATLYHSWFIFLHFFSLITLLFLFYVDSLHFSAFN